MTPKTQSVCKHCLFEIYFSDFYKSWLHKKVVAETLHVAEPVAEPASTGEREMIYHLGQYVPCGAARPSAPSAPQTDVPYLKRCAAEGWDCGCVNVCKFAAVSHLSDCDYNCSCGWKSDPDSHLGAVRD